MQKILITGAAGMLGADIAENLFRTNKYEVFGTGRKNIHPSYNYIQTNLLNDEEIDRLLNDVNPDIIIHCAANVDLNDCEVNTAKTNRLHSTVSQKLALYKPGNCKIIYISTDSVYGDNKGNFKPVDATSPLNNYALSKLKGEEAVINANTNSLILRTNIYGFNKFKEGNSLFEWIYKNLQNSTAITGFADVFFNPLYTGQLADLIAKLIAKNVTGIHHAGCNEFISKYDFALLIAKAFGFDSALIKQGNSDDFNTSIKRPKDTTINTDDLKNNTGNSYSINEGIAWLKEDFIHKKNYDEQHNY